jgi:hypothetical protein
MKAANWFYFFSTCVNLAGKVERRKSAGNKKAAPNKYWQWHTWYFTQLGVKPAWSIECLSSWIKTVLKGQRRELKLLVISAISTWLFPELFLHSTFPARFTHMSKLSLQNNGSKKVIKTRNHVTGLRQHAAFSFELRETRIGRGTEAFRQKSRRTDAVTQSPSEKKLNCGAQIIAPSCCARPRGRRRKSTSSASRLHAAR